jgi:tRNA1Val (adenine37-N6)-methyltransferase
MMEDTIEKVFNCKQFKVLQSKSTMKVNTDAILLGAWIGLDFTNKVLDIGTGTGIIALMIAQRTKENVAIIGVEIDEDSANEASVNFELSQWSSKLECKNQSIQDFSQMSQEKYDLIVSNPPFFTGGTFSDNENKNNVKHAVKLSHGDLLIVSNRLLSIDGRLSVVLPFIEGERFIDRAKRMGFTPSRITEVRTKVNQPIARLLIELVKNNKQLIPDRDQLILLEEGKERNYTTAYMKLTADFYTIF